MTRYPRPRWRTPLPAGVVGSWGPDVADYAARELGIRFDRWARVELNRALAYGADLRLVHRIYLLSVARQCGKTTIVRAVVGWALTAPWIPDWSVIMGLAYDRTQARIPYEAVLVDLEPIARRAGPIGRGGLALTRYLGIRSAMHGRRREYHTASREAPDAIRSYSIDLGVLDEIRTQRDERVWAALLPTTSARPDPLIFGISTAGDDRSVLLRSLWERGLRIIDGSEPAEGFGMSWYAPPDDAAPDDPRTWRYSTPALADGRLSEATIRGELRSLTPTAFRQERLNLWSDAAEEWLPLGTWASTWTYQPERAGRRVTLGVDVAPSWRRASIAVALTDSEHTFTGMAADLDASRTAAATISPGDLIDALARAVAAWSPAAIAYSSAAAAAPHVEAWARDADVPTMPLTAGGIRAACELGRAELVGGRLGHPDDPLLAAHVRVARPSGPLEAGGWYLSWRTSTGEIDAIRAALWAVYAALRPEERATAPQIF